MRKGIKCHDCNVEEGQLHKEGCDMEVCPRCLGQLISCDCTWDGISEDKKYLLIGKITKTTINRIMWIEVPVLCALCGEKYPKFFEDDNWKTVVPRHLWGEVLCKACFKRVKSLRGVKK